MSSVKKIYHGEVKCQSVVKSTGKSCENGAYYRVGDSLRCGVHSRRCKDRSSLPKNPNATKNRIAKLKKHFRGVRRAAKKRNGQRGELTLQKLRMMRAPDLIPGVMNVFPNFKHGNRKDGIGCKTLSPKDIGPVKHGQPGLPDALSIENFHQFNKVFRSERGDDGNPTREFFVTQRKGYLDPIPHRHKISARGKNKNIPCFSVWVDKDGKKHHISYFESRQLYCTFYERAVTHLPEYKSLQKKLAGGMNLNIIGYDAYPCHADSGAVERCYLDTSRPFGHELVLFTMLAGVEYPWRKYATLI